MDDLQEGTGTLESKCDPKDKSDVSYSIKFPSVFQRLPTAPNMQRMLLGIVNHIRSVDGREIPDEEYKLSYLIEGIQKYLYLRKYQGVWEVLPPPPFQSW